MCAKVPRNLACRWKSTSPSASALCGSTPTRWGCAARSEIYENGQSESAMGVQHQRGAEQHAGDHQSDHRGCEPPGSERRAEIGRRAFRALDNRCAGRRGGCRDGRESRRLRGLRRLRRSRPVDVFYFGNKAVALARNGIHERGLIRGIAENLPELVHGGIHVRVVVDVGIRRPELHAQLFASHDVARLLKERNECLTDLALQLNPTSTVFRAGGFVFYNLRFFSSLHPLTCQALCPPAPIGVCAPVPASLRQERVLRLPSEQIVRWRGPLAVWTDSTRR